MRLLKGLLLWLAFGGFAWGDDWLVRKKIELPFDEVRDAVVVAIENRGLVISYTSHIADMLERTRADIGSGKPIYDRAESFEFCSADLSRRMMAADPHHIVFCPFAISVYALPDEKGTWVSFRKPIGALAAPVGEMLSSIVEEAAD